MEFKTSLYSPKEGLFVQLMLYIPVIQIWKPFCSMRIFNLFKWANASLFLFIFVLFSWIRTRIVGVER